MKIIIQIILYIFFVILFSIIGGNILEWGKINITATQSLSWEFFMKILLIFFIIGTMSWVVMLFTSSHKKSKKSPEPPDGSSTDFTIEAAEDNTKTTQESLMEIITDGREKIQKIQPSSRKKTKSTKKGKIKGASKGNL
jgi:hypothetical protein